MPYEERAPRLLTGIKEAVTEGLAKVFDDFYDDLWLRNINVYYEYPMEQVRYPAIIIRYIPHRTSNLGLGHVEHLRDANGILRPFNHFLYEGTMEFTVYADSAPQVDIVFDAILEVLAFGRLEEQTNRFFSTMLEKTAPTYSALTLGTNSISSTGTERTENPWGGEDDIIYRASVSVPAIGDIYSADRASPLIPIDRVNVYPTEFGQDVPNPNPLSVGWESSRVFEDGGYVFGYGTMDAVEE